MEPNLRREIRVRRPHLEIICENQSRVRMGDNRASENQRTRDRTTEKFAKNGKMKKRTKTEM